MPVSVVMPVLDGERFIDAAIRSLLAEREAVDLDVIVIDDGSTDRTRTIVEAFSRDCREVRMVRNPRKGIAAARNTGFDHLDPRCEFVTFLDADDVSHAGRIARQRSLLVSDPRIDVLYGTLEAFTVLDDVTLTPAPGSWTRRIRGPYLQSSMYRRAVIDRVGRFDETFRQGDDTDYALRVIEHGFHLVLDDGIAGYYRRHDANVTLNVEEVHREFMRASLRSAVRHRLRTGRPLPPIYAELFLRGAPIDKGAGE